MSAKPIIAVIGATGAQGGAVVAALLKSGKYSVRAITRNTNSEKAKTLEEAGATVVQADLDEVDSLVKAFKGAYGAFFVTNYWDHGSVEKEMLQRKNLADAAQAAGVQHVVNASLEDCPSIKDGTMPRLHNAKYFVPHSDGKGEMQEYVSSKVPTTLLLTGFYYENFINFGIGPSIGKNGQLAITFPLGNTKLPMVGVADIGEFAYKLFENSSFIGKIVEALGAILTMGEVAQIFSKAFGKTVVYKAMEPSDFGKFGFPGADDMANMSQFNRDHNIYFTKNRAINFSKQLVPGLESFEDWVDRNKTVLISKAGII